MEIIQQIGSYAGLAAFVGLAVLAALYFSQARDVRRLRESQEEPSQAPPAPVAQQRAAPKPQAAKGAAAGAGSARPAQATQARPPQATGSGAAASPATQAQRPAPAAPPASPPGNDGRTGALPPRVPLPPRPPLPSQARRVTGKAGTTARQPWYRKLEPRYLVLIAAGVLVLGAGTVYGVTLLLDGAGEPAPRQVDAEHNSPAALDPSTITVSVLNATTQPGLAEQVATIVEDAGFQRGNVANFSEQADNSESVVLFAEGAQGAARQVGQALDIGRVEPARRTGAELAGNADVIVVVGEDRAGQTG